MKSSCNRLKKQVSSLIFSWTQRIFVYTFSLNFFKTLFYWHEAWNSQILVCSALPDIYNNLLKCIKQLLYLQCIVIYRWWNLIFLQSPSSCGWLPVLWVWCLRNTLKEIPENCYNHSLGAIVIVPYDKALCH